jgi:hypothetical protein
MEEAEEKLEVEMKRSEVGKRVVSFLRFAFRAWDFVLEFRGLGQDLVCLKGGGLLGLTASYAPPETRKHSFHCHLS